MLRVKLTILESRCRAGFHRAGDEHLVDWLCPPVCHELWQTIYPNVYVLLNNGDLHFEEGRAGQFLARCPDGKVLIRGEISDEEE